MSMNEAFTTNILGKTVSFDVQPYASGTGVIEKVDIRVIEHNERCPRRGSVWIKYEVYDLTVAVEKGREIRSLIAGVPNGSHNLDGQKYQVVGCDYSTVHRAIWSNETIVKATCG